MRSVHDFIHSATHSVVSGIMVHNEKDAEGMMGLARMMELFDAIDEDVIDCWNRRCDSSNGYCPRLTKVKALSIHQNLNRVNQAERYRGYDWFERAKGGRGETSNATFAMGLRETQAADVFITQKWLQNRVWLLSSTHGLLSAHSEHPELTFGYAVSVAETTLQLCQSLRLSSMEAHGIGLVCNLFSSITCRLVRLPSELDSLLTTQYLDRKTVRYRNLRNKHPMQYKPVLRGWHEHACQFH